MLDFIVCNVQWFEPWCGIDWIVLSAAVVFLFGLLVLMEWVYKHTTWPQELYRKIPHTLTGLLAIAVSWATEGGVVESVSFALVIMCAALILRHLNIQSIHGVQRTSIGTLLYGVVLLALAILYLPDGTAMFSYGVLILAFPDALAAVVGTQWGKQIPWVNKSILGSTTFFVSTVVITLFFTSSLLLAIAIAIILTILEFVSQWGSDNLTLPLLGTWLLSTLL